MAGSPDLRVVMCLMLQRSARREKSLDVLPVSDSTLTVVGSLRDTSVALDDPADVEVIHDLRLETTISVPDLEILDVTGRSLRQPYGVCALTIPPLAKLKGLSLKRGYRRQVLDIMGGTRGCSHFLTLALDLSATHILSLYLRMRDRLPSTGDTRADGTWAAAGLRLEPNLMNACLALAEDSPVQRQALARIAEQEG